MDVETTRSQEDLKLIERHLAGDEYAIEELVMKYQRKIYALAYRMTGDIEDSRDMTQNTFLKAFKNIKDFRKESSFSTWLYRIAFNTCLNEVKKKGRETVELNESVIGSTKDVLSTMIKNEKGILVQRSLKKLPERQRMTIILRAYGELSLKETAGIMKCSEGAVKAHYHNGMKKLREILSQPAGTHSAGHGQELKGEGL